MKGNSKKRTWLSAIGLAVLLALSFTVAACSKSENITDNYRDVISAIEALPAESALSLDDRAKVADARILYDALSEESKTKVNNYEKLTKSEAVVVKLNEISALTPTITSSGAMKVGDTYEPAVSGYEYGSIANAPVYSLKNNTCEAVIGADNKITAPKAGTFTVEATISYTGYNIKRNAQKVVTVAKLTTVTGSISYDPSLTKNVDLSKTVVTLGSHKATVASNGSWQVSVPEGTYELTARHTYFAEKTKENVTVSGDTTSAPEIVFDMFEAHGSVAHSNDGKETVIDSNFAYDYENKLYTTTGGLIRSGVSRINFNAMQVAAGADFVFKADLIYTGYMAGGHANWPVNAYHHGLSIYDGNNDIKESEYSYGLLLTNASISEDKKEVWKGQFRGFSDIDTAPTKYDEDSTTSTPSNVDLGMQGEDFGVGLPKANGTTVKGTLTYVRKNNVWYMIAEVNNDGTTSRYVRQASGDMAAALQTLDDKTIYLGLVNQVSNPKAVSENNDNKVKWGNIYFATGTGVADGVDLGAGTVTPDEAIAAIDALPAKAQLTLENKAAVEIARTKYNGVADEEKESVTNYAKLTEAEETIATLEAIDALTPTHSSGSEMIVNGSYTPAVTGHEYAGATASVVYTLSENTAGASLTEGTIKVTQEGSFKVTATVSYEGYNITKTVEWTVTVDPLPGPTETVAAIEALPQKAQLTLENKETVEAARLKYDALTEDEKAAVTNYAKLTEAEETIAVLEGIDALTPAHSSSEEMTAGVDYTPEVTNYEYTNVTASVEYTLSENTAGASIVEGVVSATQKGSFKVTATVSYEGYNITKTVEWTVTVKAPLRQISGHLMIDPSLTNATTDFTGATVKVGEVDATVSSDGSWTITVHEDTYTVTATHPYFRTKTASVTVSGSTTTVDPITFDTWSAKGNGVNANRTVYDKDHTNTYNFYKNASGKGDSRVDFDGITVGAGEDFVLRVDILWAAECLATLEKNDYKIGLTIHDGIVMQSGAATSGGAYSYGLLLAGDSNGRFMGYENLDVKAKDSELGLNESRKSQGAVFGTAPALPTTFDTDKITLTYVRKSNVWYMIAEWSVGTTKYGYVRKATGDMATALQKLDDTDDIHLGLSLGPSGIKDNTDAVNTVWANMGNLYFAKGTGVADDIALAIGCITPDATIAAIEALPATSELTLDNKTAVEGARALYNALTDATKEKVTNYETLTAAEGKMPVLEVVAAIAALPAKEELTLDDASAVTAAATKLGELTDAQQAEVTNTAKLTEAENTITVLNAIDKLTVTFTSGTSMTTEDTYTPAVTGYAYEGVTVTVAYEIINNTAGATIDENTGVISVSEVGAFAVKATVSYAGYSIQKTVEQSVNVLDAATATYTVGGTLSCAALSSTINMTNATVKLTVEGATYAATVESDGSWSVSGVPADTYTITATHPYFVTKTVENVTVGSNITDQDIAFDMWKATDGTGKTNGEEGSKFSYDGNKYVATGIIEEKVNNAYSKDIAYNGESLIKFGNAMTVTKDQEFVFSVKLLHSGIESNETVASVSQGGTRLLGLGIFSGADSYGLILSNFQNGKGMLGFLAVKGVDLGLTNTNKSNKYLDIQGADFGFGYAMNASAYTGNLIPDGSDAKAITLTYVRKNVEGTLKWYMIAEWPANYTASNTGHTFSQRNVRELSAEVAAQLNALDTITLGLVNQITDGRQTTANNKVEWSNITFATGSEAAGSVSTS